VGTSRRMRLFPGKQEPFYNVWHVKEGIFRRNREDGNVAFQSGDLQLAVVLYSEALRYAEADPVTLRGEDVVSAASNRSAALFQLGRYRDCLQDVELALEAGASAQYKLLVRRCKCLLQLGYVSEAQKTFDRAVDAIDRSGVSRDLRQGLATELQEAFIRLATQTEAKEDSLEELFEKPKAIPPWAILAQKHSRRPAASSAVRLIYDEAVGRRAVADRDIKPGEVLFFEESAVYYLDPDVNKIDGDHKTSMNTLSFRRTPRRRRVMSASPTCPTEPR